jgi:hypothetical protein
MSGCSLCGERIKEGFHGHHHNVSLPQRMYMFAGKNKGSVCICTIALIIGLVFILRKK